jgi:hypothetical protein
LSLTVWMSVKKDARSLTPEQQALLHLKAIEISKNGIKQVEIPSMSSVHKALVIRQLRKSNIDGEKKPRI